MIKNIKEFIKNHPIGTAFFLMFCFALGTATMNEAEAPAELRPAEVVACEDFTSLAHDIDAGILVDTELRARIQTLYGLSKGTSLEKTSEMLLSAVTSEDENRLQIAYLSLIVLCQDIGK